MKNNPNIDIVEIQELNQTTMITLECMLYFESIETHDQT